MGLRFELAITVDERRDGQWRAARVGDRRGCVPWPIERGDRNRIERGWIERRRIERKWIERHGRKQQWNPYRRRSEHNGKHRLGPILVGSRVRRRGGGGRR